MKSALNAYVYLGCYHLGFQCSPSQKQGPSSPTLPIPPLIVNPPTQIIYEPKVKYHLGDTKRPPPISDGLFGWIPPSYEQKNQNSSTK